MKIQSTLAGSLPDHPEHRVSLVDELLRQQTSLATAAERFSSWHEDAGHGASLQERFYKKLIPLTKPAAGEQYAFEVNLDQCTGCKACVAACHSLNGLDDDESWRDTGTLLGPPDSPYMQTVTTACHHCADPACANGCPVLAYEKDSETGIVRHLDDQCIGCSYCVMKCPYDVPKWNAKRGIVRKCDMCQSRLKEGEAPACVQACPNEAIAIRIVSKEEILHRSQLSGAPLLPGAFDSSYTRPSTHYISTNPPPERARCAGSDEVHAAAPHWPLAWMLILTQLSAGLFLFAPLLSSGQAMKISAVTALAVLGAGLFISTTHLGQPLRAWRCFLGLRKSWLSREIMVFGGFMKCAALAAIWTNPLILTLAALTGITGVFCSAMVYVDTRRPFWAARITFVKFLGTTLLLGGSAVAAVLSRLPETAGGEAFIAFSFMMLIVGSALAVFSVLEILTGLRHPGHPLHRPARVMWNLRRSVVLTRAALFLVSTATAVAGLVFSSPGHTAWWAVISMISAFLSQVLERHLFFVAVDAPRMVISGDSSNYPRPS